MCLTIPVKVIKKTKSGVVVDYGGKDLEIKNIFIDVEIGDFVLVQNHSIINKIPEKEAKEILQMFSSFKK